MFKRKSQLQRLGEAVRDSLDADGGTRLPLLGKEPGNALKAALPTDGKGVKAALPQKDTALKAGLVAGGLAGLTAGSAGISSLRRRREEAGGDS